jgi:hypothetical protein
MSTPKADPDELRNSSDARRAADYELRVTVADHLERIADALEAGVDLLQTAAHDREMAKAAIVGAMRGYADTIGKDGNTLDEGATPIREFLRAAIARLDPDGKYPGAS